MHSPWVLHGVAFWLAAAAAVVVCVVGLALLHLLPNPARRALTIALTFLGGLFYFFEFFIPPNPATQETMVGKVSLTAIGGVIGDVVQVIFGFTFLLGTFNLLRIHGNNIRRRRSGWPSSIAFFVAFIVFAIFAFWRDWFTWFGPPHAPAPVPAWVRDVNPAHAARPHDVYTFLFDGLYRNLDATMFSILAFYIVSAAYRAFRIRSGEAAVLMVVALVLMMGQVPLGMAVTNWIPNGGSLVSTFRIENLSQFVLKNVNGPVQRAIEFGLGLGSLAMALRIWLSLERGTYFGQEA